MLGSDASSNWPNCLCFESADDRLAFKAGDEEEAALVFAVVDDSEPGFGVVVPPVSHAYCFFFPPPKLPAVAIRAASLADLCCWTSVNFESKIFLSFLVILLSDSARRALVISAPLGTEASVE